MSIFQVFYKLPLLFEHLGADVTRVRSDATNTMNTSHMSSPILLIFCRLEANATLKSRGIAMHKLHVPYHATSTSE